MPKVLANYGPTLLVEFPDGHKQEVIRESFERAFPGGQYPDQAPGTQLGAEQPAIPGPLDVAPPPPPVAPPAPPAPSFTPPRPIGAFGAGPVAGQASPLRPPIATTAALERPEPPARLPPSLPLHDVRRGDSIQTLPEYAQGTREYGSVRIEATQDLADLESEELARAAGALDEHHRRAGELEERRMRAHEEGLKAADARGNEIRQLAKEYNEAKIDRGRLFANMSTGSKILAAIGLGLSAIGQAKSGQGGPNPALQIILGAIENDVQDQMAMIDKKGNAIEQQRGLYKDMLERLGNRQSAYDMAVAISAGQAKRQIEIIGTQSQSEKVKLAARDMSAQLGQVVADKEELIRQQASQEAYRLWQMRMAELRASGDGSKTTPGSSGPQSVWTKGEGGALELEVGPGTKFYDQSVYFGTGPDGRENVFLAGNAKDAEDLSTQYSDIASAIDSLSNMRQIADSIGFKDDYFITASELSKYFKVEEINALMKLKERYKLGVLSGSGENSDATLLRTLTGGGKAKWGDIKGLLSRTESVLEKGFTEQARAKGYRGPIKFSRVEKAPPPPTWDRSAKNVMDSRLTLKDRLGAIDRMNVGLQRDDMAMDAKGRAYDAIVERVGAERDEAQRELDRAIEQQPDRASPITEDVVARARKKVNDAETVHRRLLKEQEKARKELEKHDAGEAASKRRFEERADTLGNPSFGRVR